MRRNPRERSVKFGTMHEISIANSVVDVAREHAEHEGAAKVTAITLRIGALSCVHKQSLLFGFELVSKETLLEGAELKIVEVPVTIFCVSCRQEVELPGIQQFCCPFCQTPSADIRRGRELDIESIEIIDRAPTTT